MKRWLHFLRRKWFDLPLWQKLFVGLFVIMLLMRWMFADYIYRTQRDATIDAIDKELLVACFRAMPIIGDHLHDHLPKPPPNVTTGEFEAKVEALTALADSGDTETDAIYTVFPKGEEYVFGIASMREDMAPHDAAMWGERWQLPPVDALEKAYRNRQVIAKTYEDEGGHFRTVFVPTINAKGEVYLVCADIKIPVVESHINRDLFEGAMLGFVMLLLSGLMIVLTWAGVSRPLRRIVRITEKEIQGDFQTDEADQNWLRRMARQGQDEIGRLAGSILTMQNALRVYIEHIRESAVERGRVAAEVSAASEIQLSMLPKPFAETDPDERRVEVAGVLEPAGDVGGDFFDFARVGEHELYFAVGDVAGRGIASAMLMAIVRTQLRTMLHLSRDDVMTPSALLREANAAVKHCDRGGLYVSLLAGLLDLRTGTLRIAMAGVHAPWLLAADGTCRELPGQPHPPIGVLDEIDITDQTTTLQPGDRLVLCTNGTMWARNADSDILGPEGLRDVIAAAGDVSAEQLSTSVRAAVFEHLGLEPLPDDLALLAVRYLGP